MKLLVQRGGGTAVAVPGAATTLGEMAARISAEARRRHACG
jgi:hypothetical protein